VFNFGLYLLLGTLFKRAHAPGRIFAPYLVIYGFGRFALEWTRGDVARGFVFGGALSTSQMISLGMIAVGAGLHFWVSRRGKA
jgi:phosphatidylglycerol:prolipoprotein diacylglycerol transferase